MISTLALFRFLLRHPNRLSRLVLRRCPRLAYRSANQGASFLGQETGKGAFTLSFDLDVKEDVAAAEKLLPLLAKYGLRAVFACTGKLVEDFPGIHRRMAEEGHEIMNHGYAIHTLVGGGANTPRHFVHFPPQEQREDIRRCHEACEAVTGVSPRGFRTPHFGFGWQSHFGRMLLKLGYQYSSSRIAPGEAPPDAPFGAPYQTEEGLLEFPLSICPDHPLQTLDTWHALSAPGALHKEDGELLEVLRFMAITATRNRNYVNLYFDPYHPGTVPGLEPFLAFLAGHREELWVATYAEIYEKLRVIPRGANFQTGDMASRR